MQLLTNQNRLRGTLQVPSDKSISHRSIMFGAVAHGTTCIRNFLQGDDCLSTLKAFQKLGVLIEQTGTDILVHGQGFAGLQQPATTIDVGNSGTTIRLMMGIVAGQPFQTIFKGDESIAKRPMNRVMQPLRQMGAKCSGQNDSEFPPIQIIGTEALQPITYQLPVASAQVKSALLFAALQTAGTSKIIEKEKTRNHTEEMITQFGGTIRVSGKEITIEGSQQLQGQTITVPGDISSAAFFLAAGLLLPNSQIVLENVGLNETRTGILDVIAAMGGSVTQDQVDHKNHSGCLIVQSSSLTATNIGGKIIPRLIDELPIIALLATQANGTTIIRDAEELKVKETNRIDAVANELNKLGAQITPTDDGLIIKGPTPLHGANVTSYGDHRIGMMLAIAALIVETGEVMLEGANAISVSYPTFFDDLKKLLS